MSSEDTEVLDSILHEIRVVRSLLQMSLMPHKEEILASAMEVFGSSEKRAEVYLATDGNRNATQIAKLLNMKRPNVSVEHGILFERNIIEPDHELGGGYVYCKTPSYVQMGLVGRVQSHFGIEFDSIEKD